MSRDGRDALQRFARFLALLTLITGGLILIGYLPTTRLGGEDGVRGLFAGCGLSLFASGIGSLPVLFAARGSAGWEITPMLSSLGLRFLVVLGGAAAILALRLLQPKAFLIWLGISYLTLLVVDVRYGLEERART